MAGMKRFVTYIYQYEDKKKGNNVGFARVEIRGEECRIEIHLRGVYTGQGACRAYLFRKEKENMVGFLLGEMKLANGRGDFAAMMKAAKIAESSYGIYEMDGLCLMSEDERMFVSCWKEGVTPTVSREHFKLWIPQGAQNGAAEAAPAQAQSQTIRSPELSSTLQPKAEKGRETAQAQSQTIRSPELSPTAQPESDKDRKPAKPQSNPVTQVQKRRTNAPAASVIQPQPDTERKLEQTKTSETSVTKQQTSQTLHMQPGQEDSPETDIARSQTRLEENISATEIPMRNIFPRYDWLTIWEELKKQHPVFTPFEDKKICCIQMELKNLRELPKRYWYLGNNSFLLHGFFNYRYIIIGSIEEERWFIGIPGIYQHQERVMAAIFGFPEFIPTAVAGERVNGEEPINHFGYWYRFIEE